MTPAHCWALVTETGADGIALGPVVAPACLPCVRARRLASGAAPGILSLRPLSGAACDALHAAGLANHQVHPAEGAQRFIPPAACDGHCRPRNPAPAAPLPLEDCVGNRLGLVRRVDVVQALPGLFTAIALGARSIGSAGMEAVCSGTASAPDPVFARSLALYEALERYAAAFWRAADLRDLDDPDGPRIAMHAGDGGDGRTVMVEAARVFMPFCDNRGRWGGSSEGLACGVSTGDALERATAELVERRLLDAWLALDPPGAAPPAPAGERSALVARAGAYWMAASVAWSPAPPYGAAGFGCARDPQAALAKAARERMHVAAHQLLARRGYWPQRQAPASRLDAQLLGMADERASALGFAARVCAAPACVPAATAPAVGWRDITPPDVASFGLRVVRALAL